MPSNTITSTATTSWTAPANIAGNVVTVECWGAGGAGGNNNGTQGAPGGGGGAYARNNVTIVSGNIYPLVVGAGGAATSNGTGGTGLNSSFNNNTSGNTAMMVRGAGGTGGGHAFNAPGAGGTTANSIGVALFDGGSSVNGNAVAGSGSGGGGGATTAGAGGAPYGTASRTGGNNGSAGVAPGAGTGGNAGATTVAGNAGIQPGGGGGGSGNGGTTKVAGAGGDGQVTITWTDLVAATVTTQAASNLGETTATANGNITNTGGSGLENATERGIVYSTTTHGAPGNVAPGSSGYESVVQETAGNYAAGAYTESLTGLSAKRYYARAYVRNRIGYAYGAETVFILDLVPTAGTYALTGATTTVLEHARQFDPATYALTGQTTRLGGGVIAAAGSYSLTGALVAFRVVMPASAAAYTVAGAPVAFQIGLPAFRQKASSSSASNTTLSVTFPTPVLAGSLLVVLLRRGPSGASDLISLVDTLGDVYATVRNRQADDGHIGYLLHSEAIVTGGNCTVTVTFGASHELHMTALEYRNMQGPPTFEDSLSQSVPAGTTSTPSSPAVTVTTLNTLLLGGITTSYDVAFTPGPGYALRESFNSPASKMAIEERIVGVTGNYTAGFSLTSTGSGNQPDLVIGLAIYKTFAAPSGLTTLPASAGTYALTGRAVRFPLSAGKGTYAVAGAAVTFRDVITLPSAAGSYGLTGRFVNLRPSAGKGTYSLTGQAAFGGKIGLGQLVAAPGAYSLTTPVITRIEHAAPSLPGTYALVGAPATRGRLPLTASPSSYSLVGARVGYEHIVPADVGAYSLVGVGTIPPGLHTTMSAAAGSYAVSGQPVTGRRATRVTAFAATIVLTGSPATNVYPRRTLGVASGSFSLTGAAVIFITPPPRVMPALVGAYAVTGQAVTLLRPKSTTMPAAAGSYSTTGRAVALTPRFRAGAYAVTGAAAILRSGRKPSAAPGTYGLTGAAAGIIHLLPNVFGVPALPGSYAVAGQAVPKRLSKTAAAGSYATAGAVATLRRTFTLVAAPSTYASSGAPTALLRMAKVAASLGAYSLIGQTAILQSSATLPLSPGVGFVYHVPRRSFVAPGPSKVFTVTRRGG